MVREAFDGAIPRIVTPESLGITDPISPYIVIGLNLRFGPYQGDHPQRPINTGKPTLPIWLAYPPTGDSNMHTVIGKNGKPSRLQFNYSPEFGLTFFRQHGVHSNLIPNQKTIVGSTINQPLNTEARLIKIETGFSEWIPGVDHYALVLKFPDAPDQFGSIYPALEHRWIVSGVEARMISHPFNPMHRFINTFTPELPFDLKL